MITLKNPKTYVRQVKQGDHYVGQKEQSTANICVNLHGRVYDLNVGEIKTFPLIKIKGINREIGYELLERYPFLIEIQNLDKNLPVDEGMEKSKITEQKVFVEPLSLIDGLGKVSVSRLRQAGIISLEDWLEFKKDNAKLVELLGPLVAKRFEN